MRRGPVLSIARSLSSCRAISRLTLALRHYDRALAPNMLAQAAASPAIERCKPLNHYPRRLPSPIPTPALYTYSHPHPHLLILTRCAAEARIELACFYLTWSDATAPLSSSSSTTSSISSSPGMSEGSARARHLETALGHARASLSSPQAQAYNHTHHTPTQRADQPDGSGGGGGSGGSGGGGGSARRCGLPLHMLAPSYARSLTPFPPMFSALRCGLPPEVRRRLVEVEQRVLRELIKLYTAMGRASRANAYKAEYRASLAHSRGKVQ